MLLRVAREEFSPSSEIFSGWRKTAGDDNRSVQARTSRALIRKEGGKKKVNKHFVMKINDTNHTQDLTHFSLFNCDGRDALIFN